VESWFSAGPAQQPEAADGDRERRLRQACSSANQIAVVGDRSADTPRPEQAALIEA